MPEKNVTRSNEEFSRFARERALKSQHLTFIRIFFIIHVILNDLKNSDTRYLVIYIILCLESRDSSSDYEINRS